MRNCYVIFKNKLKQYGLIGFCFHVLISILCFIIIYCLLIYGIDVVGLLKKIGLNLSKYSWAEKGGTFLLVFGINRLISPLRCGIDVLFIPIICKYLKKKNNLSNDIDRLESLTDSRRELSQI